MRAHGSAALLIIAAAAVMPAHAKVRCDESGCTPHHAGMHDLSERERAEDPQDLAQLGTGIAPPPAAKTSGADRPAAVADREHEPRGAMPAEPNDG
jgi:hypothetical protein